MINTIDNMISTIEARIGGINESIEWLAERGIEPVPETLTRLATLEDVLEDAKEIKERAEELGTWEELREVTA